MPAIKSQNAKRFITAYNQIDYSLRTQYNMKRNMTFSELIRKSVHVNHIVRKYEDDLIDFGRLRNAIIHGNNDNYIIAEPHTQVVETIEKIARLITTPPNALVSICGESVLTVEDTVSLRNVIKLMAEHSYSNLPVYKDGILIGVANGQKILELIGKQLIKNVDLEKFLNETQINYLLVNEPFKQYEVLPSEASIEQVLDLYYKNRKLVAVLITKGGTMSEPPLGIITTTNVMEMNNILENY